MGAAGSSRSFSLPFSHLEPVALQAASTGLILKSSLGLDSMRHAFISSLASSSSSMMTSITKATRQVLWKARKLKSELHPHIAHGRLSDRSGRIVNEKCCPPTGTECTRYLLSDETDDGS